MPKAEKPAETPMVEAASEVTLTQLLAELVRQGRDQNAVASTHLKRSAPRSNAAGPAISVFNPRGEKDYPMPELQCEVNMPFPQRPGLHGFTREEVELMNLVEPGDYVIELNDGQPQQLSVIGKRNHATGKIEGLRFSGPIDPDTGRHTPLFTAQNKQQFPNCATLLRQILGEKAHGVMPMAVEREKVSAFLAATDKEAAVAAGALSVSLGE
jgi:hypothetical protein